MSQMRKLLVNTRRSDVTFKATGQIDISARTARMIGINSGDVLGVMSDGTEYYLYIAIRQALGRHKAQCHQTNKRGQHYRAYSKELCELMLKENDCENQLSVAAGEVIEIEGRQVLTLITHKYIP